MKKILCSAFVAVVLLASCKDKQAEEHATPADTTTVAVDATATNEADTTGIAADAEPKEGDTVTVKGKVVEIEQGKDGYTAKLQIAENVEYSVTISIPNMTEPSEYRAVKPGEVIEVTGEFFKMGKENRLKVTSLK